MIAATEWVARAATLDRHSIAASRGEGRTAAMIEFFGIDRDLVEVAATVGGPTPDLRPHTAELER